jgi:AcrR family transcriptional regulator
VPRTNDSRDRTVRAAASLFGTRGVAGTGLRDVVAHAGTPRGSLSHHFPGGKDELIIEAVAWSATRLGEKLERLATAEPPVTVAAVLRTAADWWERALLAVNFTGGCVIAATVMDASMSTADVRRAALGAFRSWIDPLARIAASDGIPEPSARPFAVTVVASIEGALLLCRAGETVQPLHDVESSLLALATALRQ